MPKQIDELPLVSITLDSNSEKSLYKQLYSSIREAILTGRLKSGQKLPGTRSLSEELKISRNTVVLAFEQLMIEGYIESKTGAGTYVTKDLPDKFFEGRKASGSSENKISAPLIKFDKKFGPPEYIRRKIEEDKIHPFQNGLPSLDDFPFIEWFKIINKTSAFISPKNFGYTSSTGYSPLKEAISDYLGTYRAVDCTPDQIIITNGSQQGLDLISRVLLEENKNVLLEDPCYFGSKSSVQWTKAKTFPVPVDYEGIDIDYAAEHYPSPDFIYTTPSHQYPLGSIMSISRRLRLLEFANKNNAWIIEDDYDSEFRYAGNPLPSLQGMDKFSRVIYIGTFSKVMFPGLRLGYLVLPNKEMVRPFAVAKAITDRQCPILEQIALTRYITDGLFTKHIRKMRMLYKARQEFLIKELNTQLGDILNVKTSDAGMHIVAWLPRKYDDKKISKDAEGDNLIVYPLSEYIIKFKQQPGLIMGYTAFKENDLQKGVKKLRRILRQSSYS